MPKKDTENAILIQNYAQQFVHYIKQQVAANKYHTEQQEQDRGQQQAGQRQERQGQGQERPDDDNSIRRVDDIIARGDTTTGVNASSVTTDSNIPTHNGFSRLQLGLTIRSAGVLYLYAIELAICQLLCEALHEYVSDTIVLYNSNNTGSSNNSNSIGMIERNTNKKAEKESNSGGGYSQPQRQNQQQEQSQTSHQPEVQFTTTSSIPRRSTISLYEEVVDALVDACALPKMRIAAIKHRSKVALSSKVSNINPEKSVNPIITSFDIAQRLAEVLSQIDQEEGRDSGSAFSSSSNSNLNNRLKNILRASNAFIEAIYVLSLTDVYNLAPLLSGDDIKHVLLHIPKGIAFGEVMQAQIRWMLCHPLATKDDAVAFLLTSFPDFR